ncbi:MAG TPA: hypoxanthine phosphoribosyltransferase [Blastocatellia bacterium]|nr:hypoxanthine phosphoribosyltransferase [Blastocatellia bacterium]
MNSFSTGESSPRKVLIPQNRLQERVSELGNEISQAFAEKDLAIVAILKGSFIFAADLLRAITIPCSIDFMGISSYAGQPRSGVVQITKDLDQSIADRNVLLVEDIIDTGLTATYLIHTLRQHHPASIDICALLDKSARRIIDVSIPYRGFEIPDVFVVGYGMDFQQQFRNLPDIAILKSNGSPKTDVIHPDQAGNKSAS